MISADLVSEIVAQSLEKKSGKIEKISIEKTTYEKEKPLSYYLIISEMNIFSYGKGEEASLEEVEDEGEIPVTSLNLKLRGVIAGGTENSCALIEDPTTKEQKLYKLHDEINGAKIIKIEGFRVILRRKGSDEMLVLFEGTDTEKREVMQRTVKNGLSGIEKIGENRYRLEKEEVAEILDDLSNFMSQLRVTPHLRKGEAQGFRISNIKRGSFVQKIGLRNGDIIREVNGENINNPERVLEFYSQLKTKGTFSLAIERNRKKQTLFYEVE